MARNETFSGTWYQGEARRADDQFCDLSVSVDDYRRYGPVAVVGYRRDETRRTPLQQMVVWHSRRLPGETDEQALARAQAVADALPSLAATERAEYERTMAAAREAWPNMFQAAPRQEPVTETCARCGDASGLFCPLSTDGEGPHDIVNVERLTASDAAFLDRLAVHNEQGAAER